MAVCASVVSEPKPLQGQEHRSSANFSTDGCTGTQLTWSCPQGVIFDVMKDLSWRIDPTIFENVTNGTVTRMEQSGSLYIANPKNAAENFVVSVSGS